MKQEVVGFYFIAVCSCFCEGKSWPNKHASIISILVTLDYIFILLFHAENQYLGLAK